MTLHIPPEDKKIFIIKKHWFALLRSMVPLMFFLVFGLAVILILGDKVFSEEHIISGKIFLSSGLILIVWSVGFMIWTDWHLDVWVVTERRIYDIHQLSLFSREIAELRLERLQDITIEVRGIIATFLNFGHLRVQSAGQSKEFCIREIEKPYNAREIISKQVDEIHAKKPYNI